LAYLGSLGSDEEHLSFRVAASARLMIAGESASPAAAAIDDVMKVRRLTGTIFMALPPRDASCSRRDRGHGALIQL
jgi:hypothetical protein